MISVEEAKILIRKNIKSLGSIKIKLDDAVGFVLAEDIYSPINYPSFVQSSMDGYAFAYSDIQDGLEIVAVMQAGATTNMHIEKGQAVRIFTGAPLPKGADTVLIQEKAKLEGNKLVVLDDQLLKGANARLIGADIKEGELALEKGSQLSPGAIGFLASIGIYEE